jgi:plasmid rolling circle replication initiator protein Rep
MEVSNQPNTRGVSLMSSVAENESFAKMDELGMMGPTGELLTDPTARGKERPWGDKHRKSRMVASAYSALGQPRKSAACRDCGTILTFNECPVDGQKRLKQANFCRERLCPMCAWRRSLKWAADVTKVLHVAAEEHPKWGWVMLTLTQRNVPSDRLAEEMSRVLKGWDALRRRQEFRLVDGWLRTLEVTRHNDPGPWQGTWHPHIHALLAVKPTYWAGRNYVSQKRWRALWADVMSLDYDPSVEVHKVKTRAHNDAL